LQVAEILSQSFQYKQEINLKDSLIEKYPDELFRNVRSIVEETAKKHMLINKP